MVGMSLGSEGEMASMRVGGFNMVEMSLTRRV